ncbi:MAG: hypothetical protein HY707_02705 [Ignavibacteriae bacterium]|nr:hypothetical protein [Ignavibacteriota bacterium]
MNTCVIHIANRLKEYFLGSAATNDVSIFLCGGAGAQEGNFRRDIGDEIVAKRSKYRYLVFYPEDMFLELILGHQKYDLLTLENLLAQSVSAVVILLQSPGTFAELGAFSNHPFLKKKLIIVMDPKYRTSQSFINTGPIRHLRKETLSHVIFAKIVSENVDYLVKAISEAARDVGARNPPCKDLTNPIACYEFYLALLYVLDPMPRSAVSDLVRVMEPEKASVAETAAETVINGLVNNGDTLLVSGRLTVSKKGIETLLQAPRSDRRYEVLKGILSELRTMALNAMLRRQHKHFWGEAV